MVTYEEALRTVTRLERQLRHRGQDADHLLDYYAGNQKLRFASDQFRFYFAKRYVDFSDNWCQVVADSPAERLVVQGLRLPGDASALSQASGGRKGLDDDLWRIWCENGLEADSGLGFLQAISAKRSFVLVWDNPDDPTTPLVTFEDARECIVDYVPGSRRKRAAALKFWDDGSTEFATLYLPDEVWKFQRPRQQEHNNNVRSLSSATAEGAWEPRKGTEPVIPNPLGVVPMVELNNRPLLGSEPLSDIGGVTAMQDAINLLWSQLFTASDYAALGQRIILGAEVPKMPILDNNGQVVGEQPVDLQVLREKRLLWIPDENAKVAEWASADLAAYTSVIDVAIAHVAAQTRTPQHYLVGKMANLSADALKAAETGLVKKTQEKQLYFGEAIREVFRLVALVMDDTRKAKAIAGGKVIWKDAEMRSEAQLVDGLVKLRTIGFPFEFLAERYGLEPSEVERVMAMKQEEADSALFASVLSDPALAAPTAPSPTETAQTAPPTE